MQKISTPQHERYNDLSRRSHMLLLISHFPYRPDNAQPAHLNHISHKTSTGHKQRPHRDRSGGVFVCYSTYNRAETTKASEVLSRVRRRVFRGCWAVNRSGWAWGVAATATRGATARETKNTRKRPPHTPTSAANTPIADNSPFSPSTSHYLTPHD